MYSKIIVGHDATPQADDALALGKLLAEATGASLTAVGVIPSDPVWGGEDLLLRDADADFESEIRKAAEPTGAKVEMLASTSAARGLHDFAEENDVDLLILGSATHGRVGQLATGSVATRLLHGSPCSVAIAPNGFADSRPKTLAEITVGYDGLPEAQVALTEAFEAARASGAPVKIVTVAEPAPVVYGKGGGADQGRGALTEAIHEMMRARLDDAVADAPEDINVGGTLVDGPPPSRSRRSRARTAVC